MLCDACALCVVLGAVVWVLVGGPGLSAARAEEGSWEEEAEDMPLERQNASADCTSSISHLGGGQ